MKQRIQKLLAHAGVDSRRKIEQMILDGRIAVNGSVVRKLPILIDPAVDKVQVDGQPLKLKHPHTDKRLYILLNKPKHVYATNVAQGEQLRAIDLLPPDLPGRVFPVGRLDAQSKGLLLLTNDGNLTHRLTHPRFGIPKTYRATIDGYLTDRALHDLQREIRLSEKFKIVRRTNEFTVLEITIREGRSFPLRRVFAAAGYKIRDLTRVKFGPLTLGNLAPGQSRLLSPREIQQLLKFPTGA